jgi:hypothetical protein
MIEEKNNIELPGEQPEAKPTTGMQLVGINLAVLAGYTLICCLLRGGGLILDAFIIALHVILCVGSSIIFRKWAWLLSGLVVLVIGFSTCVGIGSFYGGIG